MKHGMEGTNGMRGKVKKPMRKRMNKALAALAEPRDKITRADIITGARQRRRRPGGGGRRSGGNTNKGL